ncbi:hypothetical protein N8009_03340 [Flavobacteriaceae bacterium]|nr:hypothetical protein [Flavobacteriaceae bacterium]
MKTLFNIKVLVIICSLATFNASGQCAPEIKNPLMLFSPAGETLYRAIEFSGCDRPSGASVTFINVPSWLSINYSFNNNTSISITASLGYTTTTRSAEVVCSIPQLNSSFTLFVSQNSVTGSAPECSIDDYVYGYSTYTNYTNYLTLANVGGNIAVQYPTFSGVDCSNDPLTFYNVPDWMSIHTSHSSNSISIRINYESNHSYYDRKAHVIGYKDGAYMSIPIKQEKCVQPYSWYPDTDGDGYGDYLAQATSGCLQPFPNAVTNNKDKCPNTYSTVYYGCESYYLTLTDKNSISTKTKDITGLVKSNSISYFNGLGKNIQNQTVDKKTNRTWTSQTLYDSQGRTALTTLSAPINVYNGIFTYSNDFMHDSNNGYYSNSDFESDPENPSPVGSNQKTLGRYYSTLNTNAFNEGNDYQDITPYPFSRTIYSKLNPGAVLKTIGGNKVDTDNDGDIDDNDTWLQSYTFSMPASQELSQANAFNSVAYNSPNNRKIMKTVVRDVHGIENVVFTDTDGKTLAAARSGGGQLSKYVYFYWGTRLCGHPCTLWHYWIFCKLIGSHHL